jgi:acyl-CoA thioesterase YciA
MHSLVIEDRSCSASSSQSLRFGSAFLGRFSSRMPDRIPLIRVTAMPADTNPYGGVFGGWLMGQMGLAAGSLASRHSKGKAVVVAADELRFTGAMKVGDELSVYGKLKEQGTSSMTVAVEAVARHRNSDDEFRVATGIFKFVALNENGKPRAFAAEEESNG